MKFLILTLVSLLPTVACAQSADSHQAIKELNDWLALDRDKRPALSGSPFARTPLSREDAQQAKNALWKDHEAMIRATRTAEMKARSIELNGKVMKFETVDFPSKVPVKPKGRSLFISMHGGGGAPHEVNESQWKNQIQLSKAYAPQEGIYLAPRAPTDTWNLWHEAHIDTFFDRLIENLIVLENVNPNRVYILGYSAGGDGVYQLAPRMADRLAAASMMAGHPNEASPLGLRNVPFAIQAGGNDAAYKRNEIAADRGKKLDELQNADPKGYEHFTEIYPGKGHWMDLEDRKAIPWMEKFTRQPLPDKIVWRQDDVTHARLYWLEVPPDKAAAGQEITATRDAQTLTLTPGSVRHLTVLLNDAMLDLDEEIIIKSGDKEIFRGLLPRTAATLERTLTERGDPDLVFAAEAAIAIP